MMKNLLLTIVCGMFMLSGSLSAQVYRVDISDMIDGGLALYVKRVIEEAEANNARALLVEVNTFGGELQAATEIRDQLLATEIPTYAFINQRAISAGALITLACDTIGITPASTIGAATAVDMQGVKASEKIISYTRSEMRSTAEATGRNPKIAEAMVDEELEIEGLSEKGKLVTLTGTEAIEWKMADVEASSVRKFMDKVGLGDEEIVNVEPNWAERLVRILTHPEISVALMMLGLGGLFFEVKSPGWGVPGTVGMVCLGLFFGSHYLVNLANSWEIILFFLGAFLLILEIFIIPGFGIPGILGVLLMVGSLYFSLIGSLDFVTGAQLDSATRRVALVLLLTVVASVLFFKYGPKTKVWSRIALADEQKADEGYVATPDYTEFIGKTGVASSPLRPAGTGMFDGKRLDVVSEGGFINEDSPIEIIGVEGYRLIVRAKEA